MTPGLVGSADVAGDNGVPSRIGEVTDGDMILPRGDRTISFSLSFCFSSSSFFFFSLPMYDHVS